MARSHLLTAALPLLALAAAPGCFWGDVDSQLFLSVSADNYEQFEGLLYPDEDRDRWRDIFDDRPVSCLDTEASLPTCGGGDKGTGLFKLFLPYESSRVRGLITQKGDLQITSHLNVGEALGRLEDDGFGDWQYMQRDDRAYGVSGQGCGADAGEERTGAARCLREALVSDASGYRRLSEDLRLVITINLPGIDDVRAVACQDRPSTFAAEAWEYPRTLHVNYSAAQPVELPSGDRVYGDPEVDPALDACDIEVYARFGLGIEGFEARWFGQEEAEDGGATRELVLDRVNGPGETMLGTVELEELILPQGPHAGHARGRYNLSFTSARFAARDGAAFLEGGFDVELKADAQAVDEPERATDLELE